MGRLSRAVSGGDETGFLAAAQAEILPMPPIHHMRQTLQSCRSFSTGLPKVARGLKRDAGGCRDRRGIRRARELSAHLRAADAARASDLGSFGHRWPHCVRVAGPVTIQPHRTVLQPRPMKIGVQTPLPALSQR